jgi:ATP-dependent DNA helicase RecQ
MKNQIYSNMKNGSIDVLVATKAFGVGVNIPDIRHVIHMGIPKNLSCLVQESGRADEMDIKRTAMSC